MSKQTISTTIEENSFASHILFHKNKYVAFGAEPHSDFVRFGNFNCNKSSCIYFGHNKSDKDEVSCEELFNKVFELSDPALHAYFRLQSWQLKFLLQAIKSFNATHIKFYGNDDGLFVNIFDVLRALPEARMNRKHETRLLTHQLKDSSVKEFDMTFNASSFAMLPIATYDVGFGKNKVGIFTDETTEDVFLLRDPEIQQPIIHFTNKAINSEITLSLHPNNLNLLFSL